VMNAEWLDGHEPAVEQFGLGRRAH
jgi:hypothetical protein